MNCIACERSIIASELLCCSACRGTFHYACLNLSKAHFDSYTVDVRRTWKCTQCQQITRRSRNDDTPVRTNPDNSFINDTDMSIDDRLNEDLSVLGETLTTDKTARKPPSLRNNLTLEQISQLLDSKLEKNRKSILTELKMTIQDEITAAINRLKLELTEKTTELTTEQTKLKTDIQGINEKVRTIELECDKLKNDIKLISEQNFLGHKIETDIDCSKKFVIFGLNEYYRETEEDLNDRILHLFGDILNLNLLGYIEDVHRIGKRGPRRPIVVELISKRMTRYILQNARYFKNTGLVVTSYLTGEALKEKKALREKHSNSRRSDMRATLRESKLSVDGKEYAATTSSQSYESQLPQHATRKSYSDTLNRHAQKPLTIAEMLDTFRTQ